MEYKQLNHIMEELRELHKLHHKMVSQHCFDLTPEQAKLLFVIKEGHMSQKEIAKHFRITEATLSVRIKRLVDSGLIERKMNRDDKRVYKLSLSDEGEKMVNEINGAVAKYEEIICRGISQEDYEHVVDFIHQIQNNLKEEMK